MTINRAEAFGKASVVFMVALLLVYLLVRFDVLHIDIVAANFLALVPAVGVFIFWRLRGTGTE